MAQKIKYNLKTRETIIETVPDRELTTEDIKQEKINEIDRELESIDNKGLNRILEDIITHTGIYKLMYDDTRALIDKKVELRAKREELVEELQKLKMVNEAQK